MQELGKLFGGPGRVKIMRLFVFNEDLTLDRDDVAHRVRVSPETASKELAALARAGLLRRKTYYKEQVRSGSSAAKKRKAIGWTLNQSYVFLQPLTNFLKETLAVSHDDVRKRLKGVGTIRLLVLSGIFTGTRESVLDLMIVGDRIDESTLASVMKLLEAELGRELRYATLSTEEYQFRRRVRDKLVRDVFDYPHEALIDRLLSS